jgi:O-antigen ligase
MGTKVSALSFGDTKTLPMTLPQKGARFLIDQEVNVAFFFAIHVPLAVAMKQFDTLATIHAFATLAVGLWFALIEKRPHRVAYVCAYIAGSEALWRSAGADVFWEFGKYATCAVILVSLFQHMRWRLHGPGLLYFGLLVPSMFLTMQEFDFDFRKFREPVSFNMSGPLAIMLSLCFFSNVRLTAIEIRRLFVAAIGPIVGVASMAAFSILTAQSVYFYAGSNVQTSGGWGPNEVAAVLGLGAFLAFFVVLTDPGGPMLRAILVCTMIVFVVQSALTFSRGGLYIMAGASIGATVFLTKKASVRRRLATIAVVLVLAVLALLFQANRFTGGALLDRFENLNMTHREEFITDDLSIWKDSPIFGVGPGLGAEIRGAEAHTEFTRVLAEHGIFGLIALLVLTLTAVDHFTRASNPTQKAMVASMTAWGFLYMAVNSLRGVMPAFTLGLSAVTVLALANRSMTLPRGQARAGRTAS